MSAVGDSVLVLEGDEASRRELELLLEGAGYDVSSPDTCEAGLRAARGKDADVLLLDEQFSGRKCSDLLAEFKGASATADVRVILLSSGGDRKSVVGSTLAPTTW